MKRSMYRRLAVAAGVAVTFALPAHAVPVTFSDAGADAASIQDTVDAFRAQIGGANNGNTPGTQPTGRREINRDGGRDSPLATQFPTPLTPFSTPGTGNIGRPACRECVVHFV